MAGRYTLEEVGRYYEQVSLFRGSPEDLPAAQAPVELAPAEIPEFARERIGIYLDSAATLGRRTAEMHLALGAPATDPEFSPEPFTAADLNLLLAALREHATQVFSTLKESLSSLSDDVVERAALVLAQRRRILNRFAELEGADLNSPAFASTAITTSARSSGSTTISCCSISKASPPARLRSAAPNSRP